MYDDLTPGVPREPDASTERWLPPAPLPAPEQPSAFRWADPAPSGLEAATPAEPSRQVLRRIEATAQAAGALQSALVDLELELSRLQRIVLRASPAMLQMMQAATEVRAAGIDVSDDRW